MGTTGELLALLQAPILADLADTLHLGPIASNPN